MVERKWRGISSRFDQRSSMTQECSTWVVLLPGVKHYIIVLLCSWFQFFSISRGNKWAATKWVYSDPQMWTQPCRVDKPHNYPPFQNSFLWPPQQCNNATYLIFVIFLHEQNFWRIKFTPKKRVNYDKIHSKLPIFCVITTKYTVNCQFFALNLYLYLYFYLRDLFLLPPSCHAADVCCFSDMLLRGNALMPCILQSIPSLCCK